MNANRRRLSVYDIAFFAVGKGNKFCRQIETAGSIDAILRATDTNSFNHIWRIDVQTGYIERFYTCLAKK